VPLSALEIRQFRCFEGLELRFDRDYNLCLGPNASGKTSLLEAVYYLGRGRSFRTRRLHSLIRSGAHEFLLVGTSEGRGVATTLGIRGTRTSSEVHVAGGKASATDLGRLFSPYVIDPEVHRLLEDGPQRRRRFLDWGVFHVEPGFLALWQRYYRALRQRNAALKLRGVGGPSGPWDRELLEAGELLTAMRGRYLERMSPLLGTMGEALLGAPVTVLYQPGWPSGLDLAAALAEALPRDERYGQSHVGPHRADLTVRVGGLPARERVSRGQQKLLAAALTLAQLSIQEREEPGLGALLLDDPAAELDAESLSRLVAVVRGLGVQLFVTSLDGRLPGFGAPGAMFHVEQGTLRSR
jgi:DNA replication and repair protein RecF